MKSQRKTIKRFLIFHLHIQAISHWKRSETSRSNERSTCDARCSTQALLPIHFYSFFESSRVALAATFFS